MDKNKTITKHQMKYTFTRFSSDSIFVLSALCVIIIGLAAKTRWQIIHTLLNMIKVNSLLQSNIHSSESVEERERERYRMEKSKECTVASWKS